MDNRVEENFVIFDLDTKVSRGLNDIYDDPDKNEEKIPEKPLSKIT